MSKNSKVNTNNSQKKDTTKEHCILCGRIIDKDKKVTIFKSKQAICNICACKIHAEYDKRVTNKLNKIYSEIREIIQGASFTSDISQRYYKLFKSTLKEINSMKTDNIETIDLKLTNLTILINHFILDSLREADCEIKQTNEFSYIVKVNKSYYELSLCDNPYTTLDAMKHLYDETSYKVKDTAYLADLHFKCIYITSKRCKKKPKLPWLVKDFKLAKIYKEQPILGDNIINPIILYRQKNDIEKLSKKVILSNVCEFNKFREEEFDNAVSTITNFITNMNNKLSIKIDLDRVNNNISQVKANIIALSDLENKSNYTSSYVYNNILGLFHMYVTELNTYMLKYLSNLNIIEGYKEVSTLMANVKMVSITYPNKGYTEPNSPKTFFLNSPILLKSILSPNNVKNYNPLITSIISLTSIIYNAYAYINTNLSEDNSSINL